MNTVEISFSPTGGTEKVAHIIQQTVERKRHENRSERF